MSSDRTAKRREIEDSTAARLAEIVAAAEKAAKQVIDEAEEEARARLDDAHEEADRIVAERLAGLAELTDEIGSQAEALRRQAEALQRALVEAKAELGGAEEPDVPTRKGRVPPAPEPGGGMPVGPALTVVGPPEDGRENGWPGTDRRGTRREEPVAEVEADGAAGSQDFEADGPRPVGTPAGARLLATQMAVSGSSREEIAARLRSGFAISDTRSILDAILGPEN
ncbi:MAG TPA: hypothetical protein VGI17_14600 [Solirubrobacterales bacterium]